MTNIIISQTAAAEIMGQFESAITALKTYSAQIEEAAHQAFDAIPQVHDWNASVDSALNDAKTSGKNKGTDLAADAHALIAELENLKEQVRAHVNTQLALAEETAASLSALETDV